MNYDLYFAPRITGTDIPPEDIFAYFRDRPYYLIERNHALYNNEDTGVKFIFVYEKIVCDDEEGEITPEEDRSSIVSFFLGGLHPHFFLREALPELEAFIEEFDLIVEDPHEGGMGRGDFSKDLFITGWDQASRKAYEITLRQKQLPHALHSYPTDALDKIWQWNHTRDDYQEEVGDHMYVPLISFIATPDGAKSVVAWTDAMSAIIPKVDIVLIPRQKFAPRGLFRRKIDVTMAEWPKIEPKLQQYPYKAEPVEHYILNYVNPPNELEDFITQLQPIQMQLNVIPLGEILNAERVQEALAS